MPKLTLVEINAGKSKRGGFSRATLAKWGVAWPPKKGWRRDLMRDRTTLAAAAKPADLCAWFDGACMPVNPGGHTGFGALIKLRGSSSPAWTMSGYLGEGPTFSNNVAEYAGAIAVLKALISLDAGGSVEIIGDSRLVVEQMNGKWRAKGGLYVPWADKAKMLLHQARFRYSIRFRWIPREENTEADELSRIALSLAAVGLQTFSPSRLHVDNRSA